MPGECDLQTLLKGMQPELQDGVFVFCAIPDGVEIPAAIRPHLVFREQEATTIVVRREQAECLGLPYHSHRASSP